MGVLGGIICFYAVLLIKQKLHIDDSLDVFAVHGVGGIMGSLIMPVFILEGLGGPGFEQGGLVQQLVGQLIGVGATIIWTALWTVGIAFILTYVVPMRVDEEAEHDGLDLASHGERGWDLDA
jgi:Amt family ammonium transporter